MPRLKGYEKAKEDQQTEDLGHLRLVAALKKHGITSATLLKDLAVENPKILVPNIVNDCSQTEEIKTLDPLLFNQVSWQANLHDPLVTAGTWTKEEMEKRHLEKLKKLRELYSQQLNHIEGKLVRSVQARKKAPETPDDDLADPQRDPTPLTHALDMYHQDNSKRIHENASRHMICRSSQRCTKRALPGSQHCLEHILEDPTQVLYKRCKGADAEGAFAPCKNPAYLRGTRNHQPLCRFHWLRSQVSEPSTSSSLHSTPMQDLSQSENKSKN